jgi:molybdopterin synthase sulfur carrier subunit
MKVNFYATLRRVVGAKTVEFDLPDGSSLQQLLDEILQAYPDLRPELLDANGNLYRHVHIFVNGRDAPFLEQGMETRISSEDVFGIFPAVGGG